MSSAEGLAGSAKDKTGSGVCFVLVFVLGGGAGVSREKAKFLRPRSILRIRAVGGMGWNCLAASRRRPTRMDLAPVLGRPQEAQRDLRVREFSLRRGRRVMVACCVCR